MARKKQSTERKFLGNGTYGCVFNPPLKCASGQTTSPLSDMVGKVYFSQDEYEKERTIMELIKDSIDPKGIFTLTLQRACSIAPPTQKDLSGASIECQRLRGKEPQVIYPDGGDDLRRFLRSYKHNTRAFLMWFQSMSPIFYGLTVLKAAKMVHSDIKPSNILYTAKKKKCFIIDFGLLTTGPDMYTEYSSIKDADYVYFPPEFKLSNMVLQNKKNLSLASFKASIQRNFDKDLCTVFKQWNVNVDHDMKQLLDNIDLFKRKQKGSDIRDLMKRWTYKADIFSLGMTIIELYEMMEIDSPESKHNCTKSDQLKLVAIKQLVYHMLRINPDERWDADSVWFAYQEIFK